MKVNTFNFALKWALVIFGIDLLSATIPAITSLSGGASKPALFVFLSMFGIIAKFVVFTMAIIQFGRATENKQPASEMWLFGGLMYLLMAGLNLVSSFILKGSLGNSDAISNTERFSILTIGFGLMIGMMLLIAAMLLAGRWRTYEKAGKPGWACIVPIYNVVVMTEIGKKPFWWIFMLILPIVNIVFYIMLVNSISKAFGKDEGWTVGLIFLPFVFYPMLAWGDAKYQYGDFENKDDLDVEDHLVE